MRETRHQRILDYLISNQSASIDELSKYIDVSEATIRRDLDYLESTGDLIRVRGGALRKNEKIDPFVLPRSLIQAYIIRRLGKAAANLVQDNDTIIVSTGSTTEAMIPFLSEKVGLTIITNALNVAYQLTRFENISTIVLGGLLRHSEFDLIGHITEDSLSGLVATKFFRGVKGIHPKQGLTASDVVQVRTDRKMIGIVQDLIILADHTKFSSMGSIQVGPVSIASVIITDVDAPKEDLELIRQMGVNVITV
jgi:DeoR/GlpR family transcriptional regulator of sugar metabolism